MSKCARQGSHVTSRYFVWYKHIPHNHQVDRFTQNTNSNISKLINTCNKSQTVNLTWLSFWNSTPVSGLIQRGILSKLRQIFTTFAPQYSDTRQTIEYRTHMVFTWRMWADISHMGRMWELDGVLLPIWEEYGSGMGGSTWQRSCGTQVGPIWADKLRTLIKRSHMGLAWAKVYDSAHVGRKWDRCELKSLVHLWKGPIWVSYELLVGRSTWLCPCGTRMGGTLAKVLQSVLPNITHLAWDSHISDASHALPPHGENLIHFSNHK